MEIAWVMYCIRCQEAGSAKQIVVSKTPPQGACLICGAPLIVERGDSKRRYDVIDRR